MLSLQKDGVSLYRKAGEPKTVVAVICVNQRLYTRDVYLEKFIGPHDDAQKVLVRLGAMCTTWFDKLKNQAAYVSKAVGSGAFEFYFENELIKVSLDHVSEHELAWRYEWRGKKYPLKVGIMGWEVYLSYFCERGLTADARRDIQYQTEQDVHAKKYPVSTTVHEIADDVMATLPIFTDDLAGLERQFRRQFEVPLVP